MSQFRQANGVSSYSRGLCLFVPYTPSTDRRGPTRIRDRPVCTADITKVLKANTVGLNL